MAEKLRLTRLELKRQRDMLVRFERYLPTLKLKQQQLQVMIGLVIADRRRAQADLDAAVGRFNPYRAVTADLAGVNVAELARPVEVVTGRRNIAGVNVPQFQEARFAAPSYSLFATPPWVDRALADLRDIERCRARLAVIEEQFRLLRRELTRITQRVNLFEKVNIPRTREAIRRIRIHLGDEMTAAVARAKIAKKKLTEGPPTGAPAPVDGEEPAP